MGRSSLPYASSGRSGHFFLALIVVVGIQVFLLLTTTTCFFPVVVTTTTRTATTRNNINDDDAFTFIPSKVISTREGRQQHQKGAFRRPQRRTPARARLLVIGRGTVPGLLLLPVDSPVTTSLSDRKSKIAISKGTGLQPLSKLSRLVRSTRSGTHSTVGTQLAIPGHRSIITR